MLSRATEYALRSVVVLGLRPDRYVPAREIARLTRISAPYLSKVLQMLVRAGLVESHRGLGGGFGLARPPARMTVLEVVEAVTPIRQTLRCPGSIASQSCPLCGIHHGVDAWLLLLKSMLTRYTVADLISDPGAAPGGQGTDRKSRDERESMPGADAAPQAGTGRNPASHGKGGDVPVTHQRRGRIVIPPRFHPPVQSAKGPSMGRPPFRIRWALPSLGMLVTHTIAPVMGVVQRPDGLTPGSEVTRESKDAQATSTAAQDPRHSRAKVRSDTGAMLNKANAPRYEFERGAARAMTAGETYLRKGDGKDRGRRPSAAMSILAVVEKCAKCNGVRQGNVLGFLSHDLPAG